jgi:LmbE family N-acetylglucosaminyl deacetylase
VNQHAASAPERCIVVSAHFDDGALSVGGTILELNSRATIVTVHGGEPASSPEPSEWDALCGFASGQEATTVRRAEDIAACAALGVPYCHLPYADSPYAGDELATDQIRADLANVMAEAEAVFIPAAIGGNPDHVRARDLALSAAEHRPEIQMILYADLPYAAAAGNWGDTSFGTIDPTGHLFGSLRSVVDRYWLSVPQPLNIPIPLWAKKREAVLCHASQLVALAGGYPGFTACPGPLQHELLWRVSPKSAGPPPGPAWLPAAISKEYA